jgi:dihydropyrimidinase
MPGRDADIVVWDPDARRTIRQRDLHHTSDFTPFEGRELTGSPVHVLSRGAAPGRGRFVERRLG